MQEFTEAEVHGQAVHLGLIQDGEELPRQMRSRAVAALVQERRTTKAPAAEGTVPQTAREIVVQPGGSILIDGAPLPWLASQDAIDVFLRHDGSGSVRLTLLTESVQITQRKTDTSESETVS